MPFCNEINIDALEYKNVTTNRSGGKQVHVSTVAGSTDYKDRIRFQMCESQNENLQTAVWGLSTPLPGQDASRRSLELTIDSPDLMAFLKKMDEKNVQEATKRCQDWFKKSHDQATIASMYVSLVRPPNKPDQPSTVRIKVKCADYPTNIYVVQSEANGEITYTKGTPDDLARNVKVMAIVESAGLWFMSRQFGMSLTATELLVWPNRRASGIDAFQMSGDLKMRPVAPVAPTHVEEDVSDMDM